MKKSFVTICTSLIFLLNLNSFAKEVESSVLSLNNSEQIKFDKLPEAVQTLMIEEGKFRKKIEAFSKRKSLALLGLGGDDCDDNGGGHDNEYRCVPNCTWRLNNGDCNGYGSDFCGMNATCIVNCTWRLNNGDCNAYGPDLCY